MTIDPTAIPTDYTPPGAVLIVISPCPTCQRDVPWHCDPRRPHPEPHCPQPTCRVDRMEER